MKNRIIGGIGVLCGGALLVYNNIVLGHNRPTGLVMLIVGGYYLVKGDAARVR